jgi:hypothetical protein
MVTIGEDDIRVRASRQDVPDAHSYVGGDIHEALQGLDAWLEGSTSGSYCVTVETADGVSFSAMASHRRVAVYFVLAVYEREILAHQGPVVGRTEPRQADRESAVIRMPSAAERPARLVKAK